MRLARLDGVRGIAILLVMMHHHYFLAFTGGIGVEFFFVLSGYLITRILRGSRRSPVYWKRFYLKRVTRLGPPLVILFAVVALTTRHATAVGFVGYGLFFGDVLNVTPWMIAPMVQLWSLAVEEHFYLVWPSCVRMMRGRTLMAVAVGTIVLEPVVRLVWMSRVSGADTIYYLTPFRLDSIAFGSLLGLISERATASHRLNQVSGWAALVTAVLFFALAGGVPSFRHDANSVLSNGVGYSAASVACFFAVAWIMSMKIGSPVDRVLSLAPLTFVGRVSYGMYLFQGVVTTAMKRVLHIPYGPAGASLTRRLLPLDVLLTVAVATVTYFAVESPVREWGNGIFANLGGRRQRPDDVIAASGALPGA